VNALGNGSISRRLLWAVAVALGLMLGAAATVLDLRFQSLSEAALRAQVDAQLQTLIGVSVPDESGQVSPGLADADERLKQRGSGLYARVFNRSGREVWRSPSAEGLKLNAGAGLPPGQSAFGYLDLPGGDSYAVASRGLRYENARRERVDLTFSVLASLDPLQAQLRQFRSELLLVFGGLLLLLLAVLAAVLHWALRPLRRLAAQLTQLDSGQQQQLQGDWPRELQAVTANLNALLEGERVRIARYRQTLGNLAHSLKTPLAVIRSTLTTGGQGAAALAAASINDQVQVMSSLVDHHLKRAGSGGVTLGQPLVALAPIAQQLRLALLKVHARKDLLIELALPADAGFAGDADDLYEILGNLMDNAAKWCRGHVRVSATLDAGPRRLCVLVEDDGPGIAPVDRERVLQRGVRADQQVPGHGLGLAMVLEQAGLYGGNLQLAEADLGGLQVQLQLPGGSMGA